MHSLLCGRLGSDVIGGRGSDGDCGSDIFCNNYCVGGWVRWEAVLVAAPRGLWLPGGYGFHAHLNRISRESVPVPDLLLYLSIYIYLYHYPLRSADAPMPPVPTDLPADRSPPQQPNGALGAVVRASHTPNTISTSMPSSLHLTLTKNVA